jgi:hypothetical protein
LLIQPIALPVSLSMRTFLSKYALCSMINGFLLSTQKISFFYISLHIYLLITVYEYVECELREHWKGRFLFGKEKVQNKNVGLSAKMWLKLSACHTLTRCYLLSPQHDCVLVGWQARCSTIFPIVKSGLSD